MGLMNRIFGKGSMSRSSSAGLSTKATNLNHGESVTQRIGPDAPAYFSEEQLQQLQAIDATQAEALERSKQAYKLLQQLDQRDTELHSHHRAWQLHHATEQVKRVKRDRQHTESINKLAGEFGGRLKW